MQIGAMNNPGSDLFQELEWMAKMKLDFIDLTLEPPMAPVWRLDPHRVKRAINDLGLGVVGHTAFYLPLACPFESIRRACVDELKRCIEFFAVVGSKWMNLHPDRHAPLHDRAFVIAGNLKTIEELLPMSRSHGVGLMVENLPGAFNNVQQLGEILDVIPEVGLHLDIGHANLMVETNTAEEIIQRYGDRLKHAHLHDNKGGGADLHLSLGAGTMDVARYLRALKRSGYNDTITLEVFSEDRHYMNYSRDVLRRLWDEA
jgi:sugar phosphate isomerase/epimerase